jgi:hypothetical protein
VLFNNTFNIINAQGNIIARVLRLKIIYPDLRVNTAISG